MAQFPIMRTNRVPSGRGAGVPIPTNFIDHSGEIIGDTMARLGDMGMEEASKWNTLNAENELSESIKQAGLRLNQLSADLDSEPDPMQFQFLHEEALADIKGFRPQSKLAARGFDRWVNQRTPAWDGAVAEAMTRRVTNTAAADIKAKQSDYLGKLEAVLTDTVLANGTKAAYDLAEDPAVIADANRANVGADDLMLAVRRAASNAELVKGEAKANVTLTKVAEETRQEAAKREINGLLMNLGDPRKPQPSPELIHMAGLSAADELHYLNVIKSYSKEGFQDDGSTLAAVLQKRQDGTLTNDEVWASVGKGLSPQTAQQLTDKDSFYSDWGFKQSEQFLKGSLNYSEIAGWEHPEGQLAYQRAMAELTDAILKSDPPIRGQKIVETAYRISIPHLTTYWRNVSSAGVNAETREALTRQLKTLGGKPGNEPVAAPTAAPQPASMTEQEKAKEIFGIR